MECQTWDTVVPISTMGFDEQVPNIVLIFNIPCNSLNPIRYFKWTTKIMPHHRLLAKKQSPFSLQFFNQPYILYRDGTTIPANGEIFRGVKNKI